MSALFIASTLLAAVFLVVLRALIAKHHQTVAQRAQLIERRATAILFCSFGLAIALVLAAASSFWCKSSGL